LTLFFLDIKLQLKPNPNNNSNPYSKMSFVLFCRLDTNFLSHSYCPNCQNKTTLARKSCNQGVRWDREQVCVPSSGLFHWCTSLYEMLSLVHMSNANANVCKLLVFAFYWFRLKMQVQMQMQAKHFFFSFLAFASAFCEPALT